MNDDDIEDKMYQLNKLGNNVEISEDAINKLARDLDKLGTVTGGYVEQTQTGRVSLNPQTFNDAYNQREAILERRVVMLERQVEELTKVLKFFKTFLPQEED